MIMLIMILDRLPSYKPATCWFQNHPGIRGRRDGGDGGGGGG
eukprot:COSAG01_NODE_58967_length_303_cov_0.446078_1_plen_41_part_10